MKSEKIENTPIDVVVPMVFPQDVQWQQEFNRHRGNHTDVMRNVRFRSWNTEELLVQCVRKNMPWVRYIHILLACESQVQKWMRRMTGADSMDSSAPSVAPSDEGPQVRIVYHREFIPPEHLPCFSSPCIEMFLHLIPDLSEHFIYANDDMFPLSPLEREDFFRPVEGGAETDGFWRRMSRIFTDKPAVYYPCQRMSERPFPANPNIFQRKCMYQQNMVGAPFGRKLTTTWLKNGHSFAPILKSSCEEVWRRHGEEILRYISPLKRTDRSYNHYIYLLYQYFSGRTIDHAPREQYIGRGTPTEDIAEVIRDTKAGIVCLNDNEHIADWERRASIVRKEIMLRLKRE